MDEDITIEVTNKPAWFQRPMVLMLLVSIGTLLGLVICFLLWFNSTSDLDEVRVCARSKGVALSYEELLGPGAGDADAVAALHKLTDLSDKLVVFADSSYAQGLDAYQSIPSFSSETVLYPGMQPAAELINYYNAVQDQTVIKKMFALIDKLAVYNGQYLRAVDLTTKSDASYLSIMGDLSRFLCEYALAADTAEVFNQRMSCVVALIYAMPEGPQINSLVQMAIFYVIVNTAQVRFVDLNSTTIKALRELKGASNNP